MRFIRKHILKRLLPLFLMVAVVGSVAPFTAFAADLSVDVQINGSDGPVTINQGDTYTYTWTSSNATACQMTSPVASGVSLSGSSNPIGSGPFYPTAGTSVTITVTCTDGSTSVSDSATISLATAPAANPTIDVKANGQDGTLTINAGNSYSYTWTSTDSTACQMTSPVASGIALSGSSNAISSGNFYPTAGSPVTITVVCTNGSTNVSDSVVVALSPGGGGSNPTVDMKANGSDGPVTIASGASYTYTWTSTNATACQMTSPVASGVSLSGSSNPISSGNFYPAVGSPVTITVVCTDGSTNASDSVVINLSSGGGGGSSPTVDVKANGSDGPVTINQGDTYTYTWTSTNATACQMTSPVASGISLSGSSNPIGSGNFYPAVGAPVTITVICTNGVTNVSDSVVINLAAPSNSSGGGGSSRTATASVGAIGVTCPFVHDYMRIDFQNDTLEVAKLQAFLRVFMGYNYVSVNGVFDQATYQAVGEFQMVYKNDILTPWGHTAPTHYVYMLTLKKINEIYCQHSIPLTPEQQNEVATFRTLYTSARASGTPVNFSPSANASDLTKGGSGATTTATTTIEVPVVSTSTIPIELPIVGQSSNGQNSKSLAAALVTFPDSLKDTMQFLFELVLILLVLYVLGVVIRDVLYSDLPENALKRFLAKWVTIVLGLLGAIIIAYVIGEYYLLLPLLVALVGSCLWMAFYPRHEKIKTTARGWYKTKPAAPAPAPDKH